MAFQRYYSYDALATLTLASFFDNVEAFFDSVEASVMDTSSSLVDMVKSDLRLVGFDSIAV